MKTKLILIAGLAGVGKTTAAETIEGMHNSRTHALADSIRQDLEKFFGIPYDLTTNRVFKEMPFKNIAVHSEFKAPEYLDEVTPRKLMQTWGTEMFRKNIHKDYWLYRWVEFYKQVKSMDSVFCKKNHIEKEEAIWVIDDIRYANEITFFRRRKTSFKTFAIKIERPGFFPKENDHSSEKGIDDMSCDAIVNNDGTILDLRNKIEDVIESFIGK